MSSKIANTIDSIINPTETPEDPDDHLSPLSSESISPPPSIGIQPSTDAPQADVAGGRSRRVDYNGPTEPYPIHAGTEMREESTTLGKRSALPDAPHEHSIDGSTLVDDGQHRTHPIRRPGQTNHAQLILVGYWRASKVPNPIHKHSVVCFIDTRDRLRTRVQTVTRNRDPVSTKYPMPVGGSWVPFDQIVFEPHLVGLDQAQVKEYVKIRTEILDSGVYEPNRQDAEYRAVEEAVTRTKYGSSAESGLPIAYGENTTDSSGPFSSASKRRRTDSGFMMMSSQQQKYDQPPPGAPIPYTSVGQAHNLPPLDPLPGTRPTRILIGHWVGSDERLEQDRHAVYGILGHNDMFRVKVVRETRDGRFVDGNFPSGAGALWIHYEEVVLEQHLQTLTRNEVKEYCRVRQWQIDHEETDEERPQNERFAVQEARARVLHGFRTGQITVMSKPPESEPQPLPQISSGPHQYQELRPAPSGREEPVERVPVRRSLPATRSGAGYRVISDSASHPPIPTTDEPMNQFGTRSVSARGPIPTPPLNVPNRQRSIENNRPSTGESPHAAHPPPNGAKISFGNSAEMQQLNDTWVRQEKQRMEESGEDSILYGGIKYEKKKAGPFKDRHVSQGTIISINGEDFVEYRVLTKPTFF